MMSMVYLDHSATTPLDPEVLQAMMPYLTDEFGNASSVYGLGQRARQAIDQARDEVAAFYGVAAKEVIFTSGGTEGDNFALQGIAQRNADRGRHVITSTIEHDAVLRSADALERDGCLVVRSGVRLAPQLLGGGHERNRRAGTENVAGIVGLAKAIGIAQRDMAKNTAHLTGLRDRLIEGVLDRIPGAALTGHSLNRLPHHASFLFQGVEGESLLLQLDMDGVAGSSGSACTSGSVEPSHVILALGYPRERAVGSLRLSVGKANRDDGGGTGLANLPGMVARLRAMAPISAA